MDGPEFVVLPAEVKQKTKRQKILTIISVTLGIVLLLGGAYFSLIYYVLLDYVTMPYITFSYRSDIADQSKVTVTIDRVYADSDYPAKFRIPRKLVGYPVTAIADSAFAGLERLEEIIFPESMEYIGENAFSNCVKLDKFNIPSQLNYIGANAFNNTAFLLNHPEGAVEIGSILYTYNGVLADDTAIVRSEDSVAISQHDNYFNLGKFSQIGAGVFYNQPGITYAEIPDNIKTISDKLFMDCVNLEEVHLSDSIQHIGNDAFNGATSLTIMEWSDYIETVGAYAFKNTNFTGEVFLGSNLTSIGEGAFQNSKAMTKITIPSGLTVIDNYVFDGCDNLSEIVFDAAEYSVNSKITSFGIAAFRGTAIVEFTIPFSVRNIQESTFENCDNLVSVFAYNNTEDTTRTEYIYDEETGETNPVQVSHGLTKITTKAFNDSALFKELVLVDVNNVIVSPRQRVTLPVTLRQLGESNTESYVFSNTSVEVLDLTSQIRFIAPALAKDASLLREVIIVDSVDMLITTIYKEAFMNCVLLEEFAMPNSVRAANSSVFEGCTSLTSVTLSTHSSFNTLDTSLFRGCTALTDVVIPSNVQAIKDRVFESCTALSAITIPSSVISMGSNVFNNCNAAIMITVMTNNNNTANWNVLWLGGSGLTEALNVTYVAE